MPPTLARQTTTGNVPSGQVLTYTTFGGAGAFGARLQSNPGFTGYLITIANFQYAHGFADVTDLGARNFGTGYLALVIPDPTGLITNGLPTRLATPATCGAANNAAGPLAGCLSTGENLSQ